MSRFQLVIQKDRVLVNDTETIADTEIIKEYDPDGLAVRIRTEEGDDDEYFFSTEEAHKLIAAMAVMLSQENGE